MSPQGPTSEPEAADVSVLQLRLRLHAILTRAVSAGADSAEALFQPCVQALGTALDAGALAVWTASDDGTELRLAAATKDDGGSRPNDHVRIGEQHLVALTNATSPVLFHNPRFDHPLFAPSISGPARHVVVVPLAVEGRLTGLLAMSSARPPTPVQDEIFLSVADLLAIAADRQRAVELLREREDGLGTLISTAPDGIVVLDPHSRIIAVNPSLERIFGYEHGELPGENVTMLMPERFRARHNSGIRRYRETGQKRISWHGIELVGLHKDGSEFPIEISFGEYARNGQMVFTGFIRDITERKRAEQRDRSRRRVVQATAVYVGSAFVVLQAADLILPVLPLPEWWFNLLVMLGFLGLPVVMAVAWGWGGTRDGAYGATERGARALPLPRLRTVAWVGALLTAVATTAFFWQAPGGLRDDVPVIAVLPFAALDDTPLSRQLAGGITDDIITAIAGRDEFLVVSSTTVLAHADGNRTVAQLGRDLAVSHVLEGSVRQAGDRIRVSVRLSRPGRDRHVWARAYDREMYDALAVQAELARQVADELARRMAGRATDR
ncbi:MAG TPA: PAS domain S-box protein [Longimicrobiales bacterium]|nr:PAS domain S-box protein [Longimicrobiales bacterium]